MDLVEDHQGEDFADARDELQPGESLAGVALGGPGNIEFEVAQQLVIVVNKGDIDLNTLTHAGIGEGLLHAVSVGLVGQASCQSRGGCTDVGVLDMGQQLRV